MQAPLPDPSPSLMSICMQAHSLSFDLEELLGSPQHQQEEKPPSKDKRQGPEIAVRAPLLVLLNPGVNHRQWGCPAVGFRLLLTGG